MAQDSKKKKGGGGGGRDSRCRSEAQEGRQSLAYSASRYHGTISGFFSAKPRGSKLYGLDGPKPLWPPTNRPRTAHDEGQGTQRAAARGHRQPCSAPRRERTILLEHRHARGRCAGGGGAQGRGRKGQGRASEGEENGDDALHGRTARRNNGGGRGWGFLGQPNVKDRIWARICFQL